MRSPGLLLMLMVGCATTTTRYTVAPGEPDPRQARTCFARCDAGARDDLYFACVAACPRVRVDESQSCPDDPATPCAVKTTSHLGAAGPVLATVGILIVAFLGYYFYATDTWKIDFGSR